MVEAEAVRLGLARLCVELFLACIIGRFRDAALTAVTAYGCDPFDSHSVADLEVGVVGSRSKLDNLAYAFVPAHLVGKNWLGKCTPLVKFALAYVSAQVGYYRLTELHITPRSEWHTPEY